MRISTSALFVLLAFRSVCGSSAHPGLKRKAASASPLNQTGVFPFDHSTDHLAMESRIVGGSPAPDKYPYFATTNGDALCGASLVYEDVLLTAAHCLGAFANGVTVGAYKLPPVGESRTVTHQTRHLDYDEISLENDIMVLKMDSPVSANPVAWNTDPSVPSGGETLTVMGFGHTSHEGEISKVLLEVNTTAVDHNTCSAQYAVENIQIYEDSMFCCSAPGKGACQGDSGGPMIDQTGVQVGIVSWGIGCAHADYPGVYTRVGNYANWIENCICKLSSNRPAHCPPPDQPPDNAIKVRVFVQNDQSAYENLWSIYDDTHNRVAEQISVSQPYQAVNEIVYLVPGQYYLVMVDTAENGIFNGFFAVYAEDDNGVEYQLAVSNGNFGQSKTLSFSVAEGYSVTSSAWPRTEMLLTESGLITVMLLIAILQ